MSALLEMTIELSSRNAWPSRSPIAMRQPLSIAAGSASYGLTTGAPTTNLPVWRASSARSSACEALAARIPWCMPMVRAR